MFRVMDAVSQFIQSLLRGVSAATRRLHLTARGLWLLVFATATVAVSAIVALGVGEDVTQHNGTATTDPQHLRFFVDHRPGWLISAARAVTAIGAVPVLGLLAIAAAVALWWRGQRLLVALAPGIALGSTGAIVAVTKQLVGRARPDLAVRLVADKEASFPSGHSADSVALFVTLAVVVAAVILRRPLARACTVGAAVLLSGLIGLSRLILAAHWPTDVIAGWALGLVVAVTIGTLSTLVARITPPDHQQSHRLHARILSVLFARRRNQPLRPFAV